jgi:hypothetical protein
MEYIDFKLWLFNYFAKQFDEETYTFGKNEFEQNVVMLIDSFSQRKLLKKYQISSLSLPKKPISFEIAIFGKLKNYHKKTYHDIRKEIDLYNANTMLCDLQTLNKIRKHFEVIELPTITVVY